MIPGSQSKSTPNPHLSNISSYLVCIRPRDPIWISILFDLFNVLPSACLLLRTCSLSLGLGDSENLVLLLFRSLFFQTALFPLLSCSCFVAVPQLSPASFILFFYSLLLLSFKPLTSTLFWLYRQIMLLKWLPLDFPSQIFLLHSLQSSPIKAKS